jgi:hypothetical protein
MTLTESIEDPARGGFREALFYKAECTAVLLMHGVFSVPVRSASLWQTVNYAVNRPNVAVRPSRSG